jgi:hypothetical protein
MNIPYHLPFDPVLMKKTRALGLLEVPRSMETIPAVPADCANAERAFQIGERWEALFADRFVWLLAKTS